MSDVLMFIAAADPLPAEVADRLNLSGAEDELLGRICATAVQRRAVVAPQRRRALPRARSVVVLAAVTAAIAALLALVPSGRHDDGGPAPAFAAELVRFANASPLVLLDAPGWHVVYANEESRTDGELDYVRGPATVSGLPKGAVGRRPSTFAGRSSQLAWRSGPLSMWVRDRATSSSLHTTARVLGTTAQVFQYSGTRRYLAVTALWRYEGRVMEFGAPVTSMAMFKAELRALRRVGPDTWLRALPPSVVKTAARTATIGRMLVGIPLPPGFGVSQIRGGALIKDRYQLGTAVTGTIACTWFADWSRARERGDARAVKQAIDAMATAPRWPVLLEMRRRGAWPDVLIGYAKAMRSGRMYGYPLPYLVNAGLGCPKLGVKVPR
ncbi:MAG: hypothetical protein ACXVUL_20255 [Solirubrobacteraceae bacterium]